MSILSHLSSVYSPHTPKPARDASTAFLTEYQTRPSSWAESVQFLHTELDLPAMLFFAQTLRTKAQFDTAQLSTQERQEARVGVLHLLRSKQWPRPVQTQLVLVLCNFTFSDLSWLSPVSDLTPESFGLLYLSLVPDQAVGERSDLLYAHRGEVINFLLHSLSTDSQGVVKVIAAWLASGDLSVLDLPPDLLQAPFKAGLQAVDCILTMLKEMQDFPQLGVDLSAFVLLLDPGASPDEEESISYTRIVTQFFQFLPPAFPPPAPLLAALCEASRASVQVATLTLPAWHSLSLRPDTASLKDPFTHALHAFIKHVTFPRVEIDAQQMDDLREFRHTIGDVLKSCCVVLGADTCLAIAHQLLQAALQRPDWQDIEAPLFSMRTMGGKIDPTTDAAVILPNIFALLPSLPTDPNVQYAALLFLGRYSEWIAGHPDYLTFALQYVSAAFQSRISGQYIDLSQIHAAAAQSIKFICKDSAAGVAQFLPGLVQIYHAQRALGTDAALADALELAEGILYVIGTLPRANILQAVGQVVAPLLNSIAAEVSAQPTLNVKVVTDLMEQIEVFMNSDILPPIDVLPDECAQTPGQMCDVIFRFIGSNPSSYHIAERSCALIRRGMQFFGPLVAPLVMQVIEGMTVSFEASEQSSYLWIVGKSISIYNPDARDQILSIISRVNSRVFGLMEKHQGVVQIPDIMHDYMHLLDAVLTYDPTILLTSPSFSNVLFVITQTLSLPSADTTQIALDVLGGILNCACFEEPTNPSSAPSVANILTSLKISGPHIVNFLLPAVVGTIREDCLNSVMAIFRLLCTRLGPEISSWVHNAVSAMGQSRVSQKSQSDFLQQFDEAMSASDLNKVKSALQGLLKASRVNRQRAEQIGKV